MNKLELNVFNGHRVTIMTNRLNPFKRNVV